MKLLILLVLAGALVYVALRWRRWAPVRPPDTVETSGMSRSQACEVLGLSGDPGRDEVIEAHRRLMQKVHPDRGGSTYLAQQLNEAKRVLLSTRAQ